MDVDSHALHGSLHDSAFLNAGVRLKLIGVKELRAHGFLGEIVSQRTMKESKKPKQENMQ